MRVQGNAVREYIIGNEKMINIIKDFRIGYRVDSGPLPLRMKIRKKEERRNIEEEEKRREEHTRTKNG